MHLTTGDILELLKRATGLPTRQRDLLSVMLQDAGSLGVRDARMTDRSLPAKHLLDLYAFRLRISLGALESQGRVSGPRDLVRSFEDESPLTEVWSVYFSFGDDLAVLFVDHSRRVIGALRWRGVAPASIP